MAAAYRALDEETKKLCEGLVAIHDFYWSRRDIEEKAFTQKEKDAIPPVRHPLIRTHPETGQKAIYVGSHTREIEGWDFNKSRNLIDMLINFSTQEQFTYQHKWNVGDMVLWDNRSAMHRGMAFDDQMPNAVYIGQQLPVQDHYFNYKRKYPFLFISKSS